MRLTAHQEFSLVALRTLVGWHFAYEGFYKLMLPGWSRTGERIAAWSAEGYLKAASGPFAAPFHAIAAHAALVHAIDVAVPIALLFAGLSLMLGAFTQSGCAVAMALLATFYLSALPLSGMPQPSAEGEYLLVNKNLIELAAVGVVMAFRTGLIAGLDLLWTRRRIAAPAHARPV